MSKRRIIKLKNGAILLYKKRRVNKSTYMKIAFNIGAWNSDYRPGILHLGEHLRTKRTKELSIEECLKLKAKEDMYTNASTVDRTLSFSAYNANKNFDTTIKLMTEKMFNDEMSDEEYKKEVKIVTQEIDDRKNREQEKLRISINSNLFKDNCFVFVDLGGTKDYLDSYTQKDVQEYVSRVINSNSMVVSVSGSVRLRKVKKIVKKYVLNKINTAPLTISSGDFNFYFKEKSSLKLEPFDRKTCKILISFPFKLNGKLYGYKDSVVLSKYIIEFLDSSTGIVSKKLRTENGLIYSNSVNYWAEEVDGCLNIEYEINKDNIKKSITILAENLKGLALTKEAFDEINYLEKIRENKGLPGKHSETVDRMLRAYRLYKKFYKIKVFKKISKSITLDDVNNKIKEIFENNNRIFVHVQGDAEPKDVYTIEEIEELFFKK